MLLLFDVQSFQFSNHLVRTYLYPSGGGSYGKGPICFKRTSLSLSIWCLAGTGDDVWFGCVINRLSVSENDWIILVELLCLVSWSSFLCCYLGPYQSELPRQNSHWQVCPSLVLYPGLFPFFLLLK